MYVIFDRDDNGIMTASITTEGLEDPSCLSALDRAIVSHLADETSFAVILCLPKTATQTTQPFRIFLGLRGLKNRDLRYGGDWYRYAKRLGAILFESSTVVVRLGIDTIYGVPYYKSYTHLWVDVPEKYPSSMVLSMVKEFLMSEE